MPVYIDPTMIGYVISFYFLILAAFANQALLRILDMAGLTVIPQRITVAEMLLFIYLSCRVFCGDDFCYKFTIILQYLLQCMDLSHAQFIVKSHIYVWQWA